MVKGWKGGMGWVGMECDKEKEGTIFIGDHPMIWCCSKLQWDMPTPPSINKKKTHLYFFYEIRLYSSYLELHHIERNPSVYISSYRERNSSKSADQSSLFSSFIHSRGISFGCAEQRQKKTSTVFFFG